MRKRTVKNVAETILWYTLYLLPIIVYLLSISLFRSDSFWQGAYDEFGFMDDTVLPCYTNSHLFADIMSSFVNPENPVVLSLVKVFCSKSALLFENSSSGSALLYCSWLVYVTLLRLFVDFILFIPRLAQKWMNGFTQGD